MQLTLAVQHLPINPARDAIISYLQTGALPSAVDDTYHTVFSAVANRETSRASIADAYSFPISLFNPTTGAPTGGNPSSNTSSAVQTTTGAAAIDRSTPALLGLALVLVLATVA